MITRAAPEQAGGIAALHSKYLPGGVLARLGEEFLRNFYYRRLLAEPDFYCFLYEYEGRALGFISGTTDSGGIFGRAVRRYPLDFFREVAAALLSSPRRIFLFFDIFLDKFARKEGPASTVKGHILTFIVDEYCRGLEFYTKTRLKVSEELFKSLMEAWRAAGIKQYKAFVRKDSTLPNLFYRKRKAEPVFEFEFFGAVSFVYVGSTEIATL